MTKDEIKICPYCKSEIRPLDNHVTRIVADSPSEKRFLSVTCILTRYYLIELTEQK